MNLCSLTLQFSTVLILCVEILTLFTNEEVEKNSEELLKQKPVTPDFQCEETTV